MIFPHINGDIDGEKMKSIVCSMTFIPMVQITTVYSRLLLRKNYNRYELIDGQQRLTTLFILFKYIQTEYKPRIKLNYSLSYETRIDSETFLNSVDKELAETNIDFFHIYNAYRTIDDWFNNQKDDVIAADKLYEYSSLSASKLSGMR